MRIPDFDPWSRTLSGGDRGAALAAAGVLLAAREWPYPFPDDEDTLASRLDSRIAGRDIVEWFEPYRLEERFGPHTSGAVLASAWRRVTEAYRWSFHLKLEAITGSALWYLRQLSDPLLNSMGTFLDLPAPSAYLDWNWPIRIAFMPDALPREAEARLRQLVDIETPWLGPLLRFVDLNAPDPAADFLVFPAGRAVRETMRAAMIPVRANCLLLLGAAPEEFEELDAGIFEAVALTQAKGAILAPFDPLFPGPWFTELVREMSHNHPLDVALAAASHSGIGGPPALLCSSASLFRATRLPAAAARLSRSIGESTGEFLVDARMAHHLELETGVHPLPKVARQLSANIERFQYHAESDEATTISRIAVAAETGPQSEPREQTAVSAKRLLQCHLDDYRGDRVSRLTRRGTHVLTVRVGPPGDDWMSLNKPFPEENLPPSESGGHLLTVVLSEPVSIPEPMVSTIFLPRQGPSSTCRFRFTVSPESAQFEGRIMVLHGNRVLQTALLRGSTVYGPDTPPPEFVPETTVRPFAGLEGRRSYASAILLNHTAGQAPYATRVAGYRASLISLRGLENAILSLKNTWDACEWEDEKKWECLNGEDTLGLLRTLAVHGRLLYDALVDDQNLAERLRTEPHIQVIAARPDAHLPIEFCYSRTPPKTTAALCPHAAQALSAGTCDGACTIAEDDDSVICPLAFWSLSRVIEWHRFDVRDQSAFQNADFAIQNEPTPREASLAPLSKLLMAASSKIPAAEVAKLSSRAKLAHVVEPQAAASWSKWAEGIKDGPSTLILMAHVEPLHNLMSLEIGNEFLDPPYIDKKHVRGAQSPPPLVLLLGCGTGVSDVAYQAFPEQFRRKGAAIVVTALAQLLDVHAPRLAACILEELARPAGKDRTFGDVMLAVKRRCLADGLPIAMVLQSHGDADWWV